MKVLIVVDMQNDFIDGSLGSEQARAITTKVAKKIKDFEGPVILTRDTHQENYLDTTEGKYLPVKHCVQNTPGWHINSEVFSAIDGKVVYLIDKPNFGYIDWNKDGATSAAESIELVGLCTDICVVSNALILKAMYPDTKIIVDSTCCAGVTKESHEAALLTMKMCQVEVV